MYQFSDKKIQVGISSCLVGNKVRFDGGHKQSTYCQKVLANYFDFKPICPEMAIGMGAPRKAIRLIKDEDRIRVIASDGSFEVTEKLNDFCEQTSPLLTPFSGYIFCAKSPTCGMERVTLYKEGTNQGNRDGVGVFAAKIMADHPLMPVEEDGRLNDMLLRENFITRVFAYHKWQSLVAGGLTIGKIIQFHAAHKYLLMAHNPTLYYKLGPLLGGRKEPVEETAKLYIEGFMATLKTLPNRKSHSNTLSHLQGYFKRVLSSEQRVDLADNIDKYRQGLLPLMAPITLITHYLTIYPDPYLQQQVYLHPHPDELKLRYAH
ncbi:YbgA family protein [Psychromonas sp.]|uniref:YbgA family protein n=1 Tax=Psychromonas sp. TaxID=1884585 RepID=UPI003568CE0D